MVGRSSQNALELFKSLTGPAEFQQRYTAAIAQLYIVRRKTQARVETRQRPLEIFQRIEHKSQAGEAVGAARIGFERLLNKRQRRAGSPALQRNRSKPMEHVETGRLLRQRRIVEPLSFIQLARLLRALRATNEARHVWRHKQLRVHPDGSPTASKPLTSGIQTW